MKYTMTKCATDYEVTMSEDELHQAVFEWISRNSEESVPDNVRFSWRKNMPDQTSDGVRVYWNSDDLPIANASPPTTGSR